VSWLALLLALQSATWILAFPRVATSSRVTDYLIIQGRIPDETVRRVIERFALSRNDMMTVKASKKTFLPAQPTAIGHFLSTAVELATPITRKQLSSLLQWVENSSADFKKLEKMQVDKGYKTLLDKRYSIIDIREEDPGLHLPFGVYLDFLLPLSLRQFSISSSLLEAKAGIEGHGSIASVTFAVVEAPAMSGHGTFRGVVSSYLSSCRPGDRIATLNLP
jgi:cytochrome P450/NADPH-cytochrome P450 reductase